MRSEVVIVGNYPSQNLQAAFSGCRALDVHHQQTLPSSEKLSTTKAVVLIVTAENLTHVIEDIKSLRVDKSYRGKIITASFCTENWLTGQSSSEMFQAGRCLYLRMPFLVKELEDLITKSTFANENSPDTNRILQSINLAEAASSMGHYYKNKFALALALLREIEKLSYYKPPQVELVVDEIETLKGILTPEKVRNFRDVVSQLLEDATECLGGLNATTLLPDDYWRAFELWFKLVEAINGEANLDLIEVFVRAKQVQLAIEESFTAIAKLKDEAQQVVNYAR